MLTGLGDLLRYTRATAIVGDILKMRASDIGLGDMAIVEMGDGEQSLAQVIQLEGEEVSLQVFGGGKGLSTQAEATALAAETLYREGKLSVAQIAEKLSIAKSTLYVYLRHRGVAIGAAQQALLPPPGPLRSRPPSSKPQRRVGAAHAAGPA